METKKKVLFLFHPTVASGFEELYSRYDVLTIPEGKKFSEELLPELPNDIHVLATEFTIPVTSKVIDYFPNLQLIANYAVGFNNIDVAYAQSKNITVSNTPQAVIQPTAELSVGLLLGVSRRVAEWDRIMRKQRSSQKGSLADGMGWDLYRKTAGIIGYGNIGRAVGKILQSFGMSVKYNKRNRLTPEEEKELNVTYATTDEIFQSCDVISLHTPYTPESHHLVNASTLAMMKPDAILVNAARGKVVDEAALVEALKAKKIAGAGLDVFEHDDNPLDELYDLQNVCMTPHVGTQTKEARVAMAEELSNNIVGFFEKDRPIAIVKL